MSRRPPKGRRKASTRPDQLEGRNVVWEALHRQRRRVHRIRLDERAKIAGKLAELVQLADAQRVPIERVSRQVLDRISLAAVHNGVIAQAEPLPHYTVQRLLDELAERGADPFLLLVDEVHYEHNLGAIMRSALGAGVHAVIIPARRGKGLTPVVQRVAMGAAEEVPLIRESLTSSVSIIRRAGIPIIGADARGTPHWRVPMQGAMALILGGEDKGLSSTLRKRCDAVAAIPIEGGLQSLNVSVAAAVLMFEKVRQDESGAS